jgi:hypothetical protein
VHAPSAPQRLRRGRAQRIEGASISAGGGTNGPAALGCPPAPSIAAGLLASPSEVLAAERAGQPQGRSDVVVPKAIDAPGARRIARPNFRLEVAARIFDESIELIGGYQSADSVTSFGWLQMMIVPGRSTDPHRRSLSHIWTRHAPCWPRFTQTWPVRDA